MPASKQRPKLDPIGDDYSDVSGKQHPVTEDTTAKGVTAFFPDKDAQPLEEMRKFSNAQMKKSSNEGLKKSAILQMKKDRAERRRHQTKINSRINGDALDALKRMTLGINSAFREYGFTQEDVIEQIILHVADLWDEVPDDNFLQDRFAQIVYAEMKK